MPNWVDNRLTIKHNDSAMIDRFVKGFINNQMIGEFFPCPQDLLDTVAGYPGENLVEENNAKVKRNLELYGYANWYDWQVANWGTKWDTGGEQDQIERIDENTVNVWFDSAWSPPIEAYRKFDELGFDIEAYYNEPGIAYFGSYMSEGDEDTIDYGGMSPEEIATEYPDLDKRFEVSNYLKDCLSENLEIDLDGGLSAVNEQEEQKPAD